MTPEEERQALNEMALEDLGGPSAYGGGLQVNPAEAEAMRDRALAQYMQRKEEFDRFRQREAQRQAEQQPEPEPQGEEEAAPKPKSRQQAGSGRRSQPQPGGRSRQRSQARPAATNAESVSSQEGSIEEKLAEVPGLGPAKMRALRTEFESLEELQEAGEDDLVQVAGIGQQLARGIVRALR